MAATLDGQTRRGPWRGLVACVAAAWLAGCVAAPTLPADRATPVAAADASLPAVARRVAIAGPRGRLPRAEREALLARLAATPRGDAAQRQLAAMAAFGDVDLYAGNDARVLVDGPATFDAMFKAIEGARHSILVESYIVEDVEIAHRLAALLQRKRAEGLQVALLYDALGSFGTDRAYFDALVAAGIHVCAFNPVLPDPRRAAAAPQDPTHRDHRKIVVVDRQVGFTGGINISAVYSSGSFGRSRPSKDSGWRDTHVQIRGPAAAALDALVRETWRDQACPGDLAARSDLPPPRAAGNQLVRIVPAHPDDEYSRIYALMMAAIDTAERSLYITMAYFAPGPEMVDALCDAAARGVDVQLVLPSRSDFTPVLHAGRSHYDRLLSAGVKVYELQGAVLHAKTAVVDGVVSTVGSSNLDYRSLAGNNEINAVVVGEDFARTMTRLFQQDVAASQPITLQAWQARSPWQRAKEAAARLFESWW